jgi:hypothetical protein
MFSFQVRISHVSRVISVFGLFTDSPLYYILKTLITGTYTDNVSQQRFCKTF